MSQLALLYSELRVRFCRFALLVIALAERAVDPFAFEHQARASAVLNRFPIKQDPNRHA